MAKLQTVNIAKRVASKVADPTEQGAYNEQRATQQQLGQLNKVAQDFTTAQSNKQLETAAVQKSKSDSDFEAKYAGKQSFSAEDVEALGVEGVQTTDVDEDGNETPRDIPAHEVYPQALEAHLKKSREAAGNQIGYDTLKSRWDTNAQENENKMIAQAYEKADVDRHNFDVATTNNNISEFIENGNPEMALALAGNHPDIANRKAYKQQAKDQSDEQSAEKIDAAIANGDYAAAFDTADGIFDPELKSKVQAQVGKRVEKNAYSQAMIDGDPVEVLADLAHLKSDDYDGTLTETERKNQIQELDQWDTNRRLKLKKDDTFAVGMLKSNMELRIDEGEVTESEIDELVMKHGPKHPSMAQWRTTQQKKLATVKREKAERAVLVERVGQSHQGTGTFTADSPEAIEALEETFTGFAEENAGEPVKIMKHVSKMANVNRYIPKAVRQEFAGAASGILQFDRLAPAIAQWTDIKATSPEVLGDAMTDKEFAYMDELVSLQQSGSLVPEAVQQIKDRYKTNPVIIADRTKEFTQLVQDDDINKTLQGLVNDAGQFGGSAFPFDNADDASPQMKAEFKAQYKANYLLNGDEESAASSAFAKVNGNFGMSGMGHKSQQTGNFMKHPPEQLLSMDTDQIKKELDLQLTLAGMPAADRGEDVFLVSDVGTDVKGNPTWSVYKMDEYGNPTPIMNADQSYFRFGTGGQEYKDRQARLAKNSGLEAQIELEKKDDADRATEEATKTTGGRMKTIQNSGRSRQAIYKRIQKNKANKNTGDLTFD